MNRQQLLNALVSASHALGTKSIVPQFTGYFFRGDTVTAYDDILAIEVPNALPIQAGVPGAVLTGFLESSNAKTVEVVSCDPDGTVHLKAGRANLKVTGWPLSDFFFEMPDPTGANQLDLSVDVMRALETMSLFMGLDASNPWQMGITVDVAVTDAVMYASDNITVTQIEVELDVDHDAVFQLSPRFVSALMSLSKHNTASCLVYTDDWVVAHFTNGMRLFSKLSSEVTPERFHDVLAQFDDTRTADLPEGLSACLERCEVVLTDESAPVEVKFSKGVMYFRAEGLGIVEDSTDAPKQPSGSGKVPSRYLRRALPMAQTMALVPDSAVVLRGTNFMQIVSLVTEAL